MYSIKIIVLGKWARERMSLQPICSYFAVIVAAHPSLVVLMGCRVNTHCVSSAVKALVGISSFIFY